ncbi:hypothetical protein [Nostoc sp. CHAB 5715]|uniref:hypothetical protein n=1 Tax=Nostoc sp. CHAB 5715 TaxID=2780400 RepID=UPI001E41B545|nr:hypothetical protein [Nostoc sp. CHAB 5715]MCC5625770.1 hypothetical protein [Nostoc sp. CHAB 5715]
MKIGGRGRFQGQVFKKRANQQVKYRTDVRPQKYARQMESKIKEVPKAVKLTWSPIATNPAPTSAPV